MTLLFPRPCLTCGKLTRHGSRCAKHTASQRLKYGGDWPAFAAAWIRAHPRCVKCGQTWDLTCDHMNPGYQTLCRTCNGRKADHAFA